MQDYLRGLNPAQSRAVTSDSGKIVAIAGAGTGKTRVLTARVARLLNDGHAGEMILCVTFTRKAAAEMRERIEHQAPAGRDLPDIRTLHSWCSALLRRHASKISRTPRFSVYDDVDELDVLIACGKALGEKVKSRKALWKRDHVRALYWDRMREGNALTFDMIEESALKLLRDDAEIRGRWLGRYRHLLVDEYQDTNVAQVVIVNSLEPPNMFVVGDPRQSIYGFRGAEVGTIVRAAEDAGYETVQLTEHYRCTGPIVELANQLVEGDWEPMTPARGPDGPPVEAYRSEYDADAVLFAVNRLRRSGMAWGDIVVLGRNWRPLRAITRKLEEEGLPVAFMGPEEDPWDHEDGRALSRMLRLAYNPADSNLAGLVEQWGMKRRVADIGRLRGTSIRSRTPLLQLMADADPTGFGSFAYDWIATSTTAEHGQRMAHEVAQQAMDGLGIEGLYTSRDLMTRVERLGYLTEWLKEEELTLDGFVEWWTDRSTTSRATEDVGDKIRVMSIHASKGLEFPAVVATRCVAGVFPGDRSNEEQAREDLRLLYVMVTRAQDRLIITAPLSVSGYGGRESKPPSPWLLDAGVKFTEIG